jgi:hypothetical protein
MNLPGRGYKFVLAQSDADSAPNALQGCLASQEAATGINDAITL